MIYTDQISDGTLNHTAIRVSDKESTSPTPLEQFIIPDSSETLLDHDWIHYCWTFRFFKD
jgi:hypothetical protein